MEKGSGKQAAASDTTTPVNNQRTARSSLETEEEAMQAGWNTAASFPKPADPTHTDGLSGRSPQTSLPSFTGEQATSRAFDQSSLCPHPGLFLPQPSLHLDFRMAVTLNPRIPLGPTPFGYRNWISFTGGTWSGGWGSGIVLPGGQDSQLIIGDGSAHLDTNYILQTSDNSPAHIVIKTNGWRTGSPEVLAKLADPEQADSLDPSSYKFRLFIEMETGDERYRNTVNCGMWIGSGMRKGAEVIYDAYRVS
ncbi:unnamed protein product [Diplocarpon coronariae]|uniref:Uncharacterized protein n=1 Tax=Diplocarpon coronariae TaxID=2795749 RepID=A0A218Z5Q5_9HELO|nr:hypothetical protein B2J93_1307 [Marssonina coronariae]